MHSCYHDSYEGEHGTNHNNVPRDPMCVQNVPLDVRPTLHHFVHSRHVSPWKINNKFPNLSRNWTLLFVHTRHQIYIRTTFIREYSISTYVCYRACACGMCNPTVQLQGKGDYTPPSHLHFLPNQIRRKSCSISLSWRKHG